MRSSFKAVSTLFAALTLATPFVAHASTPAHLGIQTVCGQGAHVFNINNVGTSTTAVLRYRITARAADGMPALKSWDLVLFPLAPHQAFQLNVPQSAWGLKVSVQVFADANGTQVIAASNGTASFPNFCW